MSVHRSLVLAGSVLLVIVLYNLPKVVVDNDAIDAEIIPQDDAVAANHDFSFRSQDRIIRDSLLISIDSEDLEEKKVIFADSLAKLYLSYNKLDSAGYFADVLLKYDSSLNGQKMAGEIYFQLFSISLNQGGLMKYAGKAQDCFQKVLEIETNPDVKARFAMTKVVSDNPMEGVLILRGILEEYPNNITALYSLGLLSMQSGQYDKAVNRFEKLMTIDSANQQAAFLLATSYVEVGNDEKAKQWFEKVKNISTDPAIISSTNQYLKELNEL